MGQTASIGEEWHGLFLFFLSEYNIYNNKISQHEEYQVVWGFLVWQI